MANIEGTTPVKVTHDDIALSRAAAGFFGTYVIPEISRRLSERTLPDAMIVRDEVGDATGQVLAPSVVLALFEDARDPRILFDAEAPIQIVASPRRAAEVGDVLRVNDVDVVLADLSRLPENAGWFLLINQSSRFAIAFDFRRNSVFARLHRDMGARFLGFARSAIESGDLRVAVELLFHAAEKFQKAYLLTLPLGLRSTSTEDTLEQLHHPRVRKMYEELGNDEDGARLGNDLALLRNPANYFVRPFTVTSSEANDLADRCERLLQQITPMIADDGAAKGVQVRTCPLPIGAVEEVTETDPGPPSGSDNPPQQ